MFQWSVRRRRRSTSATLQEAVPLAATLAAAAALGQAAVAFAAGLREDRGASQTHLTGRARSAPSGTLPLGRRSGLGRRAPTAAAGIPAAGGSAADAGLAAGLAAAAAGRGRQTNGRRAAGGAAAVPEEKFGFYRSTTFVGMVLGYAVYYFTRLSFTYVGLAMRKDLGLTMVQLGAINSLFPLAYMNSKFISGVLSDLLGSPVLIFGIGLMFTGVLNIAFAMGSSVTWFTIVWALNGLFQGCGATPCNKMLVSWFPARSRGKWWSGWNASHNIGGFAIPLLAGGVAAAFGWRWGMVVPGCIAIVTGLVALGFMKDSPEKLGLPSAEVYRFPGERHDKEQALAGEIPAKEPAADLRRAGFSRVAMPSESPLGEGGGQDNSPSHDTATKTDGREDTTTEASPESKSAAPTLGEPAVAPPDESPSANYEDDFDALSPSPVADRQTGFSMTSPGAGLTPASATPKKADEPTQSSPSATPHAAEEQPDNGSTWEEAKETAKEFLFGSPATESVDPELTNSPEDFPKQPTEDVPVVTEELELQHESSEEEGARDARAGLVSPSPSNARMSPKSKSMSALGSYADLKKKTSFANVATDGVKKDGTFMVHFSNYRTGPKYSIGSRTPTSFITSSSTPAPGSYNVLGEERGKFKAEPCFSFGGSSRFGLGHSPTKKMPGPGSYNPKDPTMNTEAKVGFGSSSRGKLVMTAQHNPGPGAYEARSTLGNGRMFTAAGRHPTSGNRSRSLPGPGAYTPSTGPIHSTPPKCGFGTSMRTDFAAVTRSSCMPGPGTYEMQNFRSTGSDAPKFSATSRRRIHDLNSYVTPGPGSYNAHVTQFGY